MAILCIETATAVCSVALIRDGTITAIRESAQKNAHSAVLNLIIGEVLTEAQSSFSDLQAVAVSKGPGSYTGLRIGVSVAKGICYALDIPLISVGTLESLAYGAIEKYPHLEKGALLCPMIDARRMEVFTSVFDARPEPICPVEAQIIHQKSFAEFLTTGKMYFFGDGAEKCQSILGHQPNADFSFRISASAAYMRRPAMQNLIGERFEDVAYFEPFYLKDFIAGIPKVKGLQ